MTPRRLVAATRNAGKLREIRQILSAVDGLEVVGLEEAGVPPSPEEEAIEAFDTFHENALAKARWFAARTGSLVLADDSGLAVDALGGAPGVRSRRFAPGPERRGGEQDRANNEHLLRLLAGVPPERRTARYVCVAALADPSGAERTFVGACEGRIAEAPSGDGGFGYDPLFLVPSEGATFAEIPPARKNELSHRGRAVRLAAEALRDGLDDPAGGD